ncbi:MAG: methyltransferase domain-containing protein [Ignavibacteria bacterium]|nr:methyltransferase domain-containing protein [Ignavibacteria bacterium]
MSWQKISGFRHSCDRCKEEQVNDCRNFFSKTGYDKVKFEIGDLTKIEYKEQFDFILCVDVMEHIFEDELVFRNFANALKKGGRLLVNTPSNLGEAMRIRKMMTALLKSMHVLVIRRRHH